MDVGPISEEARECPDDFAIIDDFVRSNKKGKSKLNLPVNMSIQNIKKTLLTMSPSLPPIQRPGYPGQEGHTDTAGSPGQLTGDAINSLHFTKNSQHARGGMIF